MPVPLILLAAGRSTRFGTLKQVAPVGPGGASILAYTVLDALVVGFADVVVVVRAEIEAVIRGHLEEHLGTGLPIRYVQQPEALGTAHAALVGLAGVEGSAAIANGDDAYGRDGLAALLAAAEATAREAADGEPVRCALVAYPIRGTLSEHGGVSRGWVRVQPGGVQGETVTAIDEVYEIHAEDAAGPLSGRSVAGMACTIPRDALGSMNLWMLGPGIRPLLVEAFERHTRDATGGEFMLSAVLDQLREAGALTISLAGRTGGWFGLTFAGDLPAAASRLAAAHRAGHYATSLAAQVDAFRRG